MKQVKTKCGSVALEPIGVIYTCFQDKFGVPRQAGLVKSAQGVIHLNQHPFFIQAIRGLEEFSHLWVLFYFHRLHAKNWKPSVRPPRLGGAKKIGVLASRSPHRPNPIGTSALKIEKIVVDSQMSSGGPKIYVSGVDILDATPVLDIKPYLPYADSIPTATSGWAQHEQKIIPVTFSDSALEEIGLLSEDPFGLQTLISEILANDPRPAFQARKFPLGKAIAQGARFGMKIHNFDVKWEIAGLSFHVINVDLF